MVFSASFTPGGRRSAGVLVPVFSLRTEDDQGIGDVEGLRQFIDWAADARFGFVQLLPVNETGPDNSPYNAISSVAIEPMTIDCRPGEGLADLSAELYAEVLAGQDMEALRSGAVKYEAVRALKLDLLWRAFSGFVEGHYQQGTVRDEEFHQFCEREKDWLGDYCLFRLLMDMEGGRHVWSEWPEEYGTVGRAREFVDRLLEAEPAKTERQLVYYAFVQWIAHEQWAAVRRHADDRRVRLMGDIPFGVSLCSADVFANPALFDLEWHGGAPPERLFKDDEFVQKWGQNWGIPLYRWDAMEASDFAWWRQRVRKVTEIFSMFRIDHALGFYRIYAFPWNPARNAEFLPLGEEEAAARCGGRRPGFKPRDDESEENRAANRSDGEIYLRTIQEAAGEAAIVAEDLGMVPDYVRPSLADLEIPGMKVPQWEHDEAGVIHGARYPELSFATYATHDHLPMRTQWDAARGRLETAERDGAEWWEAKGFLDSLSKFAGIDAGENGETFPPYEDGVREKLLAALFRCASREAAVMITDLFGLEDRVNVPGVFDGTNWSHRLEPTVKALSSDPRWVSDVATAKKLLIEAGRAAE